MPAIVPSSTAVSARMSRQASRDTAPEVAVRRLLYAAGYFSAGAHSAAKGSFVVPGGAQPWLDVVNVETHVAALFLEKPPELDRYRLAFDYLQAQALDASASSAFIEQALSEM